MYCVRGWSGQRVRLPLISKTFWHKSPCLPSGNGTVRPETLARTVTFTCSEWWCEPKFTWIWAGLLRLTIQCGSPSALQLAMRMARGAGAPSAMIGISTFFTMFCSILCIFIWLVRTTWTPSTTKHDRRYHQQYQTQYFHHRWYIWRKLLIY